MIDVKYKDFDIKEDFLHNHTYLIIQWIPNPTKFEFEEPTYHHIAVGKIYYDYQRNNWVYELNDLTINTPEFNKWISLVVNIFNFLKGENKDENN